MWQVVSGIRDPFEGDCDLQVVARKSTRGDGTLNRRHFRVLEESSEEGIASNILADRLRRLVSAGLLTRADVGRGRRATYSLTEAAIELVPLLALLGEWGLRNRPTTPMLRVRAELLVDGGPAAAYAEALAAETG